MLHGAHHRQNLFHGAAAAELELAGLEQLGLLYLADGAHIVRRELLQPVVVGIGLGGDEGELVLAQVKGAGLALLALAVEILHPFLHRAGGQGDDGGLRFLVGQQVLGKEHVLIRLAHIFAESAAHHVLGQGGAGDEVVGQARGAHIEGPGVVFLPGPGDQVQREIRQKLLEYRVFCFLIAQLVLHEVQVIIHENGREIGPQQQAVAPTHKDGFYLREFLYRLLFCFRHSDVWGYSTLTPLRLQAQNEKMMDFGFKTQCRCGGAGQRYPGRGA